MLLRFCRPVPQPHLCPREPDAVRERSVEVELGLRRRRWTQRSPIDCDDLSDVEPPLDMLVMVTKLRLGDRAIIGARGAILASSSVGARKRPTLRVYCRGC
jgi:hypothetical protein